MTRPVYKLSSQHKGELLADRAVIPTLALGAIGMATMGPAGALAVLKSDFGTGIRMAAPLAMLSSLVLCADKGILVKDGRALELMNEVDTVLFDKTGILTRERPEVGRIIASDGLPPECILLFAAAAERKFHHPIALAILHRARELGLALPAERRHPVQGRLRHHRPRRGAYGPRRQPPVPRVRRDRADARRARRPGRSPTAKATPW